MAKPDGPEALDMKMEMLMEKAQSGDAQAQYEIGYRYINGSYYLKDIPAGLRWLELAAKQYHVKAQSFLANYYFNHQQSYPDKQQEIISWCEYAALRKDADAEALWGEILCSGFATSTPSSEGISYLQKHAKQGHLRSQYILAQQYLSGELINKDFSQAKYWVDLAAKSGYAPAQQLLGKMYQQGKGVAVNPTEARYWFEQAQKNNISS